MHDISGHTLMTAHAASVALSRVGPDVGCHTHTVAWVAGEEFQYDSRRFGSLGVSLSSCFGQCLTDSVLTVLGQAHGGIPVAIGMS